MRSKQDQTYAPMKNDPAGFLEVLHSSAELHADPAPVQLSSLCDPVNTEQKTGGARIERNKFFIHTPAIAFRLTFPPFFADQLFFHFFFSISTNLLLLSLSLQPCPPRTPVSSPSSMWTAR